jgi:hypothetical protein
MIDPSTGLTLFQAIQSGVATFYTLSPVIMIILGGIMFFFVSNLSRTAIKLIGFLMAIFGVLSLLGIQLPKI